MKMSSKDNAIKIDSDSDDSKTPTDNQVEMNHDDYEQGQILSRELEIGDEDSACLTYKTKDIDLMKHPYYWVEQPEMVSFVRFIQHKSPDVHFVENTLLPVIYYKCEKLPESVKIYPCNMNDGHPKENPNGHWVHFSIYKDI